MFTKNRCKTFFLQQQYQGIGTYQFLIHKIWIQSAMKDKSEAIYFLHFWPILSSLDWKLFAIL